MAPRSRFQPESDIEAEVERLKGAGVEFPDGIADQPWGRIVTFKDPDGNDLQLYQPPRRRLARMDLDEVRETLEARRDDTRARVATLAKRPERGESQGFGKRIGDGTIEAVSRLNEIGVGT